MINATGVHDQDTDGPVLLFSHGFLMDHTMFDAYVAESSGDHRWVRWDARGLGRPGRRASSRIWDSPATRSVCSTTSASTRRC